MIYVGYHFHRLAPYGVLANLLAMPMVSAWVMPMGILGIVAMPFGLDGYCWWLMGEGIRWMIAVSLWVAGLPGAVGRMAAFGIGPLVLCSAGLVVLCLLKTRLRLVGAVLIVGAAIWAIRTPQPDVRVAADGNAFAVRGADGRLAMIKAGSDTFTFREWLAADGDARLPTDKTLAGTIRCDAAGCIAKLADGSLVAIARTIEAFAEDCRRAALVLSARDAPAGCTALVIDRQVWRRSGALALRKVGQGFEITVSRPAGYDRPWAPAPVASADAAAATAATPATPGPTQPRDATPRAEDLEPGD